MNIQRIFCIFITLSLSATMATAQSAKALDGAWTGKLQFGGMSLTIVIHLDRDETGQPICTLDSPDQGAKGIKGKVDHLTDDSVAVSVASLNALYKGRLTGDSIKGTFRQNMMALPLVLHRGEEAVSRPQTPQPPFPYSTQEVTFVNDRDKATLAGTLTFPVDDKNVRLKNTPVVVMVSGSGQQNRDEEVFEHKPFLVLADFLARHGIASLRYDDRATAQSTGGDVANATTEDFMRDAAAGVEFLRRQGTFRRIGILGHSEGATIAFMLGQQKKVDFIISMGGVGVKGDTVLTAQANKILELNGSSQKMSTQAYRQTLSSQNIPWVKYFIDYDPTDALRAIRCPVMAINGALDCQVISSLNLPAIRQALPKNRKHFFKEYPGLNHLMQHCTTGNSNEYRAIEETLSPEVLEDIAEWIRRL